jgi:hypothetical protein
LRPAANGKGTVFSLKGGGASNGNHAKLGVSTSGKKHYTIFGDMNQQGTLSKESSTSKKGCGSSQNGRGGLFFAMDNGALWSDLTGLVHGDTAPAK